MAGSAYSTDALWPPLPSSSTSVSDPNSHLGFSLPQHPFADDPGHLEAFTYDKLELPWWGFTTDQPSLLTTTAGASSTSSNSSRRSPFLYAPPAASSSGPGLMSGVVPHHFSSLFDPSETEGMETWFSALKGGNSLMGTVAQWHERDAQEHLGAVTNGSDGVSRPQSTKPSTKVAARGPSAKRQSESVEAETPAAPVPVKKRRKSSQSVQPKQASEDPAPSPTDDTSSRATPPVSALQRSPSQSLTESKKSKQPLTAQQKRQNHIESEKRRRETIKTAFSALVETLREAQALEDEEQGKSKPRGRGRKGEGTGGATKNVVLAKAVEHVKSLQAGNDALRRELEALEAAQG